MVYEENFTLSVIPPLRLDLTAWALRRRQKNLMDRWDKKQYQRVLVVHENAVQVTVAQKEETKLSVTIRSNEEVSGIQGVVKEMLIKILGTEKNLESFYQLSKMNKHLKLLTEKFRGVKPPRFSTIFEALVNAIACQQITLDLGILLLNRLSKNYGKQFADQHAFPRPEDLADISEKELKSLGFSYQKARAIIELSKALVYKELSFEDVEILQNDEVVSLLMAIRGIGRWSAEYVLLRGLGRIDTFPGDDVGAQKNLMLLLNLPKRPTYDEIKVLTNPWKPYAGFIYFHLLLDKLQKKNLL